MGSTLGAMGALLVVLVFAAIIGGVVFGGMALIVQLRRSRAPMDERGPRPGLSVRHDGGFVPVSIDVAHALAAQSLAAAKVKPLAPLRRERLRGSTSISMMSWGSIVTVWLAPVQGGTNYTAESRPMLPWAMFDGTRNQRIVDLIGEALRGAAVASPGATWAPDPFHRHELRYWDGLTWTESVSDHGRTTIDPMTVSVN
jgi:Protein of unknown function (DUF2510)